MRCLLLKGGAVGDFLVTLPLLHGLHRGYGRIEISLIGNPLPAALALEAGLLATVFDQGDRRWIPLFQEDPLPSALAEWLEAFDLILCFWPDPDQGLARHFQTLRHPRCLLLPAHPENEPASTHFCRPLQLLGLPPPPPPPWLLPPSLRADELTWGLHPGSGSARKNWPVASWLQLLPLLPGRKLIFGSAPEASFLPEFAPWGELVQNQPLSVVAQRLGSCHFYLGHDSGLGHLAAALGVPSLLLFGPTPARVWAPLTPKTRVLEAGDHLATLEVSTVLNAIEALRRAETNG